MNSDQLVVKRIHWPKVAMFAFAIVLPAIAVGISNKHVFAKAFAIATIGLIVTVGICLISTYFSGNAAPKTRRYAIIHDIVIAVILCVNFLFHFQIAREISAADDARTAYREDDKRAQENLDRDTQRRVALADARAKEMTVQNENLEKQRRLLVQLPTKERRFTPQGQAEPQSTAPPVFTTKSNEPKPEASATVRTPEEVRASWFDWLFWAAAAEIFAAILGGMVLMALWQWDVDGNGIADDEEYRPKVTPGFSPQPMTAQTGKGENEDPTPPNRS